MSRAQKSSIWAPPQSQGISEVQEHLMLSVEYDLGVLMCIIKGIYFIDQSFLDATYFPRFVTY